MSRISYTLAPTIDAWDSALVGQKSTNPIYVLRTRNHQSLVDFSRFLNVNLQTLNANELGVYPEILPKIKHKLMKHFDVSEKELDLGYSRFVKEKRAFFSRLHGDRFEELPEPDLRICPFEQFRLHISPNMNRTKFAKEVCVEPAGLYRLETKPLPELPGRLVEALEDIGLSRSNIEELQERTSEFHARR